MCRLASYHLDQKGFPKDEKLVQMLRTKVVAVAGVEKQAAALDDLCGKQTLVPKRKIKTPAPDCLCKEGAFPQVLIKKEDRRSVQRACVLFGS